jgi:hypothetical protein
MACKHKFEDKKKKKKVNKINNNSSKRKSNQSSNLKSEKDMGVYMNTIKVKIKKSKYLLGPR